MFPTLKNGTNQLLRESYIRFGRKDSPSPQPNWKGAWLFERKANQVLDFSGILS